MSMFKIAKYLEINRSVDGVRQPRRGLELPGQRDHRTLGAVRYGPIRAAAAADLRSAGRGGSAAALPRPPGGVLF